MSTAYILRTTPQANGAIRPAAKTVRQDTNGKWHKVADYGLGSIFTGETRQVDGIREMAALIGTVSGERTAFLVHGPLSDAGIEAIADPNARLNRRKNAAADSDQPPHWQTDGRVQIVMHDLDDLPADGFDFINHPADFVRHVIRERFPEVFHNVTCSWQFSAKSGTYGGELIGLHLWFDLGREVDIRLYREWTKLHCKGHDPAVLMEMQPLLVGAPVFLDGASDPLTQRDGLLIGTQETVPLPHIEPAQIKTAKRETKRAQVQQKKARNSGTKPPVGLLGANVRDALAALGDGSGLGGFHDVLKSTIWHFVSSTHPDFRDWDRFKDILREHINAAPNNGTAARKMDLHRYRSDGYLDESYRGACLKADVDKGTAPATIPRAAPLDVAQARVAEAVESVLGGKKQRLAVAVSVGVGKTETALQMLAKSGITEAKRVHYYVPRNTLSAELLKRAEAAGINNARMHYGRTWEGDGIDAHCHPSKRDEAQQVEDAKGNVRDVVCARCPYQDTCGWEAQRHDNGPGLIIQPATYAFQDSAKRADLQIFDEAFWQTGLRDTSLPLSWLDRVPNIPQRNGSGDDFDAFGDLGDAQQKLRNALTNWDGTRAPLDDAGVTVEVAKRAMGICYQRLDSLNARLKNARPEAFGTIINAWQSNHRTATSEAAIWRAIGNVLEHDRPLHSVNLTSDYLQVYWRQDLKADDETPTLCLDATTSLEVLEPYLPGIELIEVMAEAPFQKVIQITDRPYGKAALVPNDDDTPDEARKKANNITDLAHVLEVAKGGFNDVGLTTYKGTIAELESRGALDGVRAAHYGDLAGRDDFRHVRCLLTFGRTEPASWGVEKLGRSLFFDQDAPLLFNEGAGYGKTPAAHWTKDGQHVLTSRSAHPDPKIDALRHAVAVANLLQADRSRGVQRTADEPVTWIIATNEPLPIAVDELWSAADLIPSRWQVAAARGLFTTNPKHAAALHPDLWPNAKAAINDRDRNGWAEVDLTSYKEIYLLGSEVNLTMVKYRPEGSGQRPTYLLATPAKATRKILEQRVGALAEFSVISDPERPSHNEADDQQIQNPALAEVVHIEGARLRSALRYSPLYRDVGRVPCAALKLLHEAGIEAAPAYRRQLTLYEPALRAGELLVVISPETPESRATCLISDIG